MQNSPRGRALGVIASGIVLSVLASAQSVPAQPPQLVLVKLSPPVYPPLARQALIEGEVSLRVAVHPDGSLDSVTVLSGHRLLAQAAVDSAKQSEFKCLACSGSDVTRTLTYTFHVSRTINPNPCCCTQEASTPQSKKPSTDELSQSADNITIATISTPGCLCPDPCELASARKRSHFRAASCLYLWKCGTRRISLR